MVDCLRWNYKTQFFCPQSFPTYSATFIRVFFHSPWRQGIFDPVPIHTFPARTGERGSIRSKVSILVPHSSVRKTPSVFSPSPPYEFWEHLDASLLVWRTVSKIKVLLSAFPLNLLSYHSCCKLSLLGCGLQQTPIVRLLHFLRGWERFWIPEVSSCL